MGIPSFYRWLVEKYPRCVVNVIEEFPKVVNGVSVPIDSSQPNPNGIEFDNLYLDMNGIIHPCFHPEGKPAPDTYEEVFNAIFKYIDRIFSMIRPRKLLFMAIDGVAPRAKMNQQRARRFRVAKDAQDAIAEQEKLGNSFKSDCEMMEQGRKRMLDSNVITPGTEFMAALSTALHYYICLRLNTDPGWNSIKVILSDACVPGEGEHKIMSYIRLQRNLPGFDPNTKHCLYGLDADLIMLALATHEVHFSILREDVRQNDANQRNLKSNRSKIQTSQSEQKQRLFYKNDKDDSSLQMYQLLQIWILREYLHYDMRIPDFKEKPDLERLIDDFVFMCVFVGNDFLPHMPSLEISEGAIDLLMSVYKREFVRMGGYLTESFEVNLERVEHFIQAVGTYEDSIFRRRLKRQILWNFTTVPRTDKKVSCEFWSSFNNKHQPSSSASQSVVGKSLYNTEKGLSRDIAADKVRLGVDGWKERYYAEKFELQSEDEWKELRRHTVLKYIEGICWVMHYYYQGVCSWQWFYPYHYAPFASDIYGLDQLEICFTLGEPFKPFDQLMAVLPAASAHALPLFYNRLVTDLSSPIADFYPADFQLDMNGKRFSWQAVCKLPFIEEHRLLAEISKIEHTLTNDERQRNTLGLDVIFIHRAHPLAATILSLCEKKSDHPKLHKTKVKKKINPKMSGGMNGYVYISNKTVCPEEIYPPMENMGIIKDNQILSVFYKCPPVHSHIPRPPEGVILPGKFLSVKDILPVQVLQTPQLSPHGHIFSERTVSNSISGPFLAKLARQLVSKYYMEKKPSVLASLPHCQAPNTKNSRLEAVTVEDEINIQTPRQRPCRRKRKRKFGDKDKLKSKKRRC